MMLLSVPLEDPRQQWVSPPGREAPPLQGPVNHYARGPRALSRLWLPSAPIPGPETPRRCSLNVAVRSSLRRRVAGAD